MTRYMSPNNGRMLHFDSAHSLSDGVCERWPVIDDIPYLRAGSEALATAALERLDHGDPAGALLLLLAQNDDHWTGAPPTVEDLTLLVAQRDTLSLRQAMRLLAWGRVGDYFAHRWSDPTFIAGLTLIDGHWSAPARGFELACGIGHYLRALSLAGMKMIGADVVFAKLWVARHWVAPEAELLCFDADQKWPAIIQSDLALCHDAFYFLSCKEEVAAQLRQVAPVIALAHIHNADHFNFSAAQGMTLEAIQAVFPNAVIYSDEELTRAGADGDIPAASASSETEAFGVVIGACATAKCGPLRLPQNGRSLRRNPLCVGGTQVWPSERYFEEYGARMTFACDTSLPDVAIMAPQWEAAARRRDLVDLPERW